MNEHFKDDVLKGLGSTSKYIPSKYFYDKIGDEIFVKIMKMPEYYLTRAELEIFENQNDQIILSFGLNKNTNFHFIELGAGDGAKTMKIINKLVLENYSFNYIPIDISKNALNGLTKTVKGNFPFVDVNPIQGEYFEALSNLETFKKPKIIFFIGSNLGNLDDAMAKLFLQEIDKKMQIGDKLILGLDLIKSPEIVIPAYNDSAGLTAQFNYNLLHRINRELKANFDISNFKHSISYTQSEGIVNSYLISLIEHTVQIGIYDFNFNEGETIHTEISRKYTTNILENILKDTGFIISHKFCDSKAYFADYILVKRK